MTTLRRSEGAVETTQGRREGRCVGEQTEAGHSPCLDDTGDKELIKKVRGTSATDLGAERPDIGVTDVMSQCEIPLAEQVVDLAEVVQFLNGEVDEARDEYRTIGVVRHERHGGSACFPLVRCVVDEERVEVIQYGLKSDRIVAHAGNTSLKKCAISSTSSRHTWWPIG